MPAGIAKSRVADGIYLLRFKTQYELAATFLRIQEHYESPRFHGRIFSLEAYMDWYAARYGNFTYYQDWSGFNVPSTALRPFYDGKFDPLSKKESRLLRLFSRLRRPFYLIGVFEHGGEGRTLKHEMAHALYFTDPAYREAVRAAIREHDTSALAKQIAGLGYAPHVVADEMQAYIIAPSGELNAALRPLKPLRRELDALFRKHAKGLTIPRIK